MKPLQRQAEFKHRLWEDIGQTFEVYSKELILDFLDCWFEMSYNGKKMRFEKEKTFDIKRRLGRFKRNQIKWNTPKEKREVLPNYFNKNLWQKMTPQKVQEYKAHLINLGWQYFTSQAGNHLLSPDGKREWL